MAALLRHIDQRIAALHRQHGVPDDLADVITQFAAVGITRYATAAPVGHDTRWIWFGPHQLRC